MSAYRQQKEFQFTGFVFALLLLFGLLFILGGCAPVKGPQGDVGASGAIGASGLQGEMGPTGIACATSTTLQHPITLRCHRLKLKHEERPYFYDECVQVWP